ncbi:MAG: hypothetical protein PHE86_06685 [Candidatus Marinimicrobia bacterium]|nr:hypothetical protein [Candidatus Neomarinimicrobiota bacterium]MDD5581702.1 hypothetical protein [Candidatus Neomarinimicrobiota bacterium]
MKVLPVKHNVILIIILIASYSFASPDVAKNSMNTPWVFRQQNSMNMLTITFKDTLVDSVACIRYQEVYSASALGGVDVIFCKETGFPLWFKIPALGEEVKVDYENRQYLVKKRMDDKSYSMQTPFDICAFPSYARFVQLLYYEPSQTMSVDLYLYNGKTVSYLFEHKGQDTLRIQNEDIPCHVWHISMESTPLVGQNDEVWIREQGPFEIMKIISTTRVAKIMGVSLGKTTAVFERVFE